jgi:hypothetical protein
VDRLWRDPPRTTAEILHPGAASAPAASLLPEKPETLSPAGYRYLYADSLGEWTVRFLLRRALDPASADRIAEGWRGDRVAFFSAGRSVAYLWRVRFASPQGAERFESAWKKSRGRRPDAAAEQVLRSGSDVICASRFAALPELPGLPKRAPIAAGARP